MRQPLSHEECIPSAEPMPATFLPACRVHSRLIPVAQRDYIPVPMSPQALEEDIATMSMSRRAYEEDGLAIRTRTAVPNAH